MEPATLIKSLEKLITKTKSKKSSWIVESPSMLRWEHKQKEKSFTFTMNCSGYEPTKTYSFTFQTAEPMMYSSVNSFDHPSFHETMKRIFNGIMENASQNSMDIIHKMLE
jgi:hypothetical protein